MADEQIMQRSSSDEEIPDMSLEEITEGKNDRGIPAALFIEDIGAYAAEKGAPAELLIGAYSELLDKYRTSEMRLQHKSTCVRQTTIYCMLSSSW